MNLKKIKQNDTLKNICLSVFWFFSDYCINHIVMHIPIWQVRRLFLLLIGMKIGNHTQMDMNITFMDPNRLKIGKNCHINRQCLIDARGSLIIGDNVSISLRSAILTGSHNHRSPNFEFVRNKVIIDNNVWMGYQTTVVGNVHVGEGAVICAGAVVTKDVEPWAIMAGVPAKKIGERPHDISYVNLEKLYNYPMFS